MLDIGRRHFLTLLGGAAAWPLAARAQQTERGARLGFLGSTSPTAQVYVERVEAFRTALRDLGYIEGKNLVLEFRWANGDYARLPELAAELLRLDMDVLVTFGTPGTLAAKRASAKIPIVMAVSGDAVASGIISSLARPGGNITGSTFLNPELVAKRFDLAKEALPSIARVAFLFNPDNPLDRVDLLQSAIKTAQTLNVELETVATRMLEEISAALSAMKSRHIDAVTATDDSMFFSHAGASLRITSHGADQTVGTLRSRASASNLSGMSRLSVFADPAQRRASRLSARRSRAGCRTSEAVTGQQAAAYYRRQGHSAGDP
jgi:putative tryptophan/tyrosine transport system substrate-binding protein